MLPDEIIEGLKQTTHAAADAALKWKGREDKNNADKAAVDAMREHLNNINFSARIFIGEGEKDKAPMLFAGEELGKGDAEYDLVVDPLEGTTNLSLGLENSMSVIVIGKRGCFLDVGDFHYMEKLAVRCNANIDITKSVDDNLKAVAEKFGKDISELVVCTQDRPRHKKLIEEIKKTGAKLKLIESGDIGYILSDDIDVLWGIFGAPEGIIIAVALKVMGGQMQGILKHKEEWVPYNERINKEQILKIDDMIKCSDVAFVATGITEGPFLKSFETKILRC